MIISKNWIIILSKGQERNHLKSIKGQKRKYQRLKMTKEVKNNMFAWYFPSLVTMVIMNENFIFV